MIAPKSEASGLQLTNGRTLGMFSSPDSIILSPVRPASIATYREMARNPSLYLALGALTTPILVSEEGTEATDNATDEMVEFIANEWDKIRFDYIKNALHGALVYGYQGFEIVYEVEEGKVCIKKAKPLLQDLSYITVDPMNGDCTGIYQSYITPSVMPIPNGKASVSIPYPNAVLFNWGQEGGDYYGVPILENARTIWNKWLDVMDAMARYAVLQSGKLQVLYCPTSGTKTVIDGVSYDPLDAAQVMMNRINANGQLFLPSGDILTQGTAGQVRPWELQILSLDGAAMDYTLMLDHLEKLMVRAILQPERALLEGNHGTKADSEVHTDVAVANVQAIHKELLLQVNRDIIANLLEVNFGIEYRNAVTLKPATMDDGTLAHIRATFDKLLPDAKAAVDIDQIMDICKIPKSDVVVDLSEEMEEEVVEEEVVEEEVVPQNEEVVENG